MADDSGMRAHRTLSQHGERERHRQISTAEHASAIGIKLLERFAAALPSSGEWMIQGGGAQLPTLRNHDPGTDSSTFRMPIPALPEPKG